MTGVSRPQICKGVSFHHMRASTRLWRLGAAVTLMELAVGALGQAVPHVRKIDASPLVERIRAAVTDRGVDPDMNRFDLVFAFMTSHFGSDPGHAEGLRQLASDCIKRFADNGDRVGIASWEMDMWDWKPAVAFVAASPEARVSQVRSLLPRTPRAGSIGGHDTERSLCSLWDKLGVPAGQSDVVVVVLGTEEASMLPPGGQGNLLGADAPSYASLTRSATRHPAVRLAFESSKTDGTDAWTPRTATAFVVVPRLLAGRPAPKRGTEVQPFPPLWVRMLLWFLGVLAVLVSMGVVAKRLVGSHTPRIGNLKVGDRDWQIPVSGESCKWSVVGEGFAGGDPDRCAVADTLDGPVPPSVLVELRFDGKARTVTVAPMQGITLKKGATVCSGPMTLEPGSTTFRVTGRTVSPDPLTPEEMFVAAIKVGAS